MGDQAAQKDFDAQGFARDIHELLVLATLRGEARHGYQIALDVGEESNGLFQFQHGTLYPILHRLEKSGMISGSWSTEGGRRRKVYTLTPRGQTRLEGGRTRVAEITEGLLSFLDGSSGSPAGEPA